MSIVDEFVTLLGLQVDPKASGEAGAFSKLLGGVTLAAVGVGAALAAAGAAITKYAIGQADAIDKEQELAATLGVSYKAFQELAYAAKLSGGDVGTLSSDLERLQENLMNPATGVQNKALTALGISAKDASGKLKSADVIVGELAGKFDKLSAAEQNTYAKLLRISPATVRLLQNGSKGLSDMAAEAQDLGLILSDKAAKSAADFGDSMDRVKATTEGVGRSVAVGLLPGLTRVVDGFTNWIKANRALISSGITQIVQGVALGFEMVGDALSAAWDMVKQFLPAMDDLSEGLDATQAIAIAVALAIGAASIAALVAAAPFLAMAAAVVAVVLVVEDLYSALTGGQSVIGDWVKSFQEAYPNVAAALVAVGEAVMWVVELVGGQLVGAFNTAFEIAKGVFGGIADLISTVLGGLDTAIGAVKNLAGVSESANASVSRVALPAPIQAGAAAQAAGAAPGGPVNITINGAGDPAAVGADVMRRGGLSQGLQQSRPGTNGPITR